MADIKSISGNKHYNVDVQGFLVDPATWDANYAMHRALEMDIPQGQLTDKHWKIIEYVRNVNIKGERIPNIYEICEIFQLEIEELQSLFPEGYHRGVLKIAGLRFTK
jgi:tRNA 2-thiouridine synthesizing protein E